MADGLPSGLLEACIVIGASSDKLNKLSQSLSQLNGSPLPLLDPEVLQVHRPLFCLKQNVTEPAVETLSPTQQWCSPIQKNNDKPTFNTVNPKEETTENASTLKELDLAALPQLCFPGGLQVTKKQKDEQFHYLVFTDVLGNQSHGVVLQFYRATQEGKQHQNGHQTSYKPPQLYTPYAVCVISKHPYYSALKDCLSSLLRELKICQMTEMEERAKEFSAKLSVVPVPPPGQLHVMFIMQPLMIVLPSREDQHHPVVDLDLHLPFLCFKSREVLQIIACILTEQRMVFFSSDWAKLTLIAECFMLYIWPLRWQHPLVPILSQHMLDFVMAPTAFIMGCHISHYEEVAEENDDLILINIDEGTVSCSSILDFDIPDVPYAAAQCFKSRRKGLRLHYDLNLLNQSICGDLNELRNQRRCWQQRLNKEIQNISLELLFNMFRDVSDYLNYEHRVFNTDEFLKTRDPEDQSFYKKVLETPIFHSFLKERLNRKMDMFAQLELSNLTEEQKYRNAVDSSRRPTIQEMRRSSSKNGHRSSLFNQDDKQVSPTSTPEMPLNTTAWPVKIFQLPFFPRPLNHLNILHYIEDLILKLNKAISAVSPDDSSLLARYFYLRGLINMQNSKRLDALSDFQNLYKTDIGVFPRELVKTLVHSLQKEERVQVEERCELRRLICQVKSKEKREQMECDNHVKKFQLPKAPMQLEEFVKCIQESGIVRDVATIQRLFEALNAGGQKQIVPELFRMFYKFWKETEAEAQDVLLPAEVLERLDNNECVYKLSRSVKTSYGVGKIAMTQKRIFLLTTGSPGYVDITKFRDIEEVKISAPVRILRNSSLKIKNSLRDEIFEANLKSECELWNLMVKEMWAGRMMADNNKDPQYVQQALTNVLLMDAVVGCLQTQKSVCAASKLAYHEKLRQEVPVIIPRDTAWTLKHKINPSQNMMNPQSVDVLFYSPGQLTFPDSDVDVNPKLWCGLGCGKVVVFDAASWSLKQNCIHLGDSRLNCMMGLDQDQVWIGSEDSVIYIINTRSMLCHKQLTEHRGELTDFTLEKLSPESRSSRAQVYSCSADGTVIVWDVPSLKVKRQFHLSCDRLQSIQIHNGALWCGARDCIMMLKPNGDQLWKIHLPDKMKATANFFNRVTLFPERQQIWTSFTDFAELCIWDLNDPVKPPKRLKLPNCKGVTCMIKVKKQVWIGCGGGSGLSKVVGKILVLDSESLEVEKELEAHEDSVQVLFSVEDRYVLSGSAKLEGRIAIWRVD